MQRPGVLKADIPAKCFRGRQWQNDVRFAARARSLETTYHTRTTALRAGLIQIFSRCVYNFRMEARVVCACARSASKAAKSPRPLDYRLYGRPTAYRAICRNE